MDTMKFVSCSETSCPLNENKECKAPSIAIDKDGNCKIFKDGPFKKSGNSLYVEVKQCDCEKCSYNESDPRGFNICGNINPLFFQKNEPSPCCSSYETQIEQPGYTAKLI